MELLSSYKNVTEFLKFQSHVDIGGGGSAMGRSHTLNNTTMFPVYVSYKIYFLNLLKSEQAPMPYPKSKQNSQYALWALGDKCCACKALEIRDKDAPAVP